MSAWTPLYAAGIAALVSIVVAVINSWSARRLDAARAYREHALREAAPALDRMDKWFKQYLVLVQEDSRSKLLDFLQASDKSEAEHRAWLVLSIATGDNWSVRKRYKRLRDARRFHARTLEEKMAQPRREFDTRLAVLEIEGDFEFGVTRGYLEVLRSYREFRRALIKGIF